MPILATNAVQIARFANALYGVQLGSATNAAVLADITAAGGLDNALNSYYASSFGSKTSAQVAAVMVANLGIVAGSNGLTAAAVTDATNYIVATLNAAPASGKGAAVKGILNLWANIADDASLASTYGAAATAWNANVAAAQAYTASNTADAAVGAVVSGQTFTLTTSPDNKVGGTGADFFDGARNANNNITLSSSDSLDGGAGSDTLSGVIGATLSTANIKNIEKLSLASTVSSGVNLSATGGYTDLTVDNSGFDLQYNNIPSATVNGAVRNSAVSTFNFLNSALSGSSDKFNLAVEGANTGVTISKSAPTAAGSLETLSIASQNSNATITTLDVSNTGINKIALSGDYDVTVTTLTDNTTGGTVINSYDASAAKGGVTIASTAYAGPITMTGGAGNDVLTANNTGDSNMSGGDGNDDLRIANAQLAATDVIDGGTGNDTLRVEGNSTVTDSLLSGVKNVEILRSGSTAGNTLTATLSTKAAAAGILTVTGGTGADSVTFQSGYDGKSVTVTLGGTAVGTNDTVTIAGTTASLTVNANETELDGSDTLTGGAGTSDTLVLTGDSGSATLGANFTAFERINIKSDVAAVSITTNDANVAANKTMTVDASVMTSGAYGLTLVASAEADGNFVVIGGAGADAITLHTGTTADTATALKDSVSGGAGNDTITLAAVAFTSADTFDGGAGTDTIAIDAAVAVGATIADDAFTNVTNVERVSMADAGVNHSVTLGAKALAAGINRVTGNTGNDTFTVTNAFTGAVTLAHRVNTDGTGADGGTDTFSAAGSAATLTVTGRADQFANANTYIGGTGTGDTLSITADNTGTAATFSSADSGFEKITLNAGVAGTETIAVTTGGMGASGTTLVIDGSALTNSSAAATIDASGETLATLSVTGGAGADVITAGSKADFLSGGAGNDTFIFTTTTLTSADTVAGGDGDDTIRISNAATVADSAFTNVTSVKTLTTATNTAMTSVTLGALAQAAGITSVTGNGTGALTSVVVGGDYTSGTVTVAIGAANVSGDTISAAQSAATLKVAVDVDDLSNTVVDTITGGTGTADELYITEGVGGGGGTLTAAMLASVTAIEKFTLGAASSAAPFEVTGTYTITTDNANVASGKNLAVNASILTTGVLNFNGANETNGTFSITSGGGADNLVGGAGNDTIDGGAGSDVIDGGAGDDSVTAGTGDDTVYVNAAGDVADGGAGADTLVMTSISSGTFVVDLSASGDQLTTYAGAANAGLQTGFENLNASSINGALTATAATTGSTITGGNASDSITGGAAADSLTGGLGNDTLTGGAGADSLVGGAGNDRYISQLSAAGAWEDTITDSAGTDTVVISGAASSASVRVALDMTSAALGTNAIDVVDATGITVAGIDLTGGNTAKTVYGTDFSDSITGGNGADNFQGGSGIDIINAGDEADTVDGGAGDDYLKADSSGENDVDTVSGGSGNDTIVFADAGENDVYNEAAGEGSADTLYISGQINASTINMNGGGAGNALNGASGLGFENVVVSGSTVTFAGAQLSGLTINFSEHTNSTTVVTVNATAAGTTNLSGVTFNAHSYTGSAGTVATSVAFTDGTDYFKIDGADGSAETITGTSYADSISGGTGDDVLSGGAGVDTITGGVGQDTITSGSGADKIIIGDTAATVTIGGAGNAGTIVGFDVITDITTGTTAALKDLVDFQTAPAAATNGAQNGTDSTLTVGGTDAVITSSTSAANLITFAKTGAVALTVTSDAILAAVVQYLTTLDIGNAGSTVIFNATYATATRGSTAHTFVYQQLSANSSATGGAGDGHVLVDLVGVTLTGWETTASTTDNVLFVA